MISLMDQDIGHCVPELLEGIKYVRLYDNDIFIIYKSKFNKQVIFETSNVDNLITELKMLYPEHIKV
jgi:hypothetical protein